MRQSLLMDTKRTQTTTKEAHFLQGGRLPSCRAALVDEKCSDATLEVGVPPQDVGDQAELRAQAVWQALVRPLPHLPQGQLLGQRGSPACKGTLTPAWLHT